jgi:hypothetical protein
MGGTIAQLPIGRQVFLPGHFDLPVTLESARPLGKGFECRVRLHDGTLDEAVISEQEAAALAGGTPNDESKTPLTNADHLRLLVESARIRLAYAHDRQFAVSLANPALKGGELGDVSPTAELSALGKLMANWQSVIEDAALTTGEREERKKGQKQLL